MGMSQENYAFLLRKIFGIRSILLDDRAINASPELPAVLEDILEENWFPTDPEYVAIKRFLIRSQGAEEYAQWIRENAEWIAKNKIAKALRCLRHPRSSRRLKCFLIYRNNVPNAVHHNSYNKAVNQ